MADQEGIVVGVNPEVVVLKLPNGTTFSIPNTPTSILIPNIASGQIVTFTFETRARRDVPTRPVIVRERRDLSWNDVVRSLQHDLQNNTRHVPDFSQVKGYAKEKGYWTPTTMRAHMIQFAKDNLSDPFDPEFWVNAFSSFSKSRSGRTIISKFSHGYSQAVRVLFPEIVFDSHKFAQQAFYKVENRRKFFENYAAKHEFDPLVPDNWYNQSKEDILSSKGALRLMQYHGNSVPKALCDLFPNIGLDRHKFPYTQRLWEDPNNRRKFFEIYAENNNFDPLIANNWYSQPIYQIMAVKGADRLLGYHGSSIAKALSDLFPDIGIDRSKFLYQQNYWNKVENRREFYEEYAAEQGFDPLIANNWYSISRDDLLSISDARKIICYHRNSVIVSLMDLFPDIGIDKAKFLFKQNHKWNSAKNRRELFENYAKENKMDPLIPQNWYKQPRQKILSFPGVWKAITYHNSSLVTTLIDLFPEIGLKKANFLLSQRNFVKDDNRRFFEKYAADNRFDPLSAEKWYTQPKDKILATKGVHRVLAHYSNSIPKALVDLFPEIGLDRMKFPMTQENWDTPMRRRQFFEKYAKEYSFNPLDPHNWYLQPKTQILDTKGAQSVLSYHNNSVSKALMDLFPDIGLDNTKFVSQSDYWSNKENQRKYFETFAKEKGFDPLESENWKFSLIGQLQSKRAIKILANYGGNLYNALTSVFPEVIFDKQKIYFDQNMWVKVGERRNFFENFAKENGFNPLIPANWYAQSKDKIMATKGAKKVISHHGVSVAKALLDLFPDIGLDKTKLLFRETGWIQASTRRKFFEDYAALHSFDSLVPENWYSTAKNQILLQKGAWGVISHHQNSISQALLDLFPEIGLQKLSLTQPLSYESEDSRRLYFENFAKSNNFDHLKYENWSDKIKESFLSLKATTKVLSFHKYKLSRALKELFPEMKIVKENRSLNSAENRRKFFEKYAQDNGFDALVANNWYLQSKDKIMAVKGAWTVICCHNRSTSKALLDLFPEIGLDKSKLRIRAG